jgi:hypothetical protein
MFLLKVPFDLATLPARTVLRPLARSTVPDFAAEGVARVLTPLRLPGLTRPGSAAPLDGLDELLRSVGPTELVTEAVVRQQYALIREHAKVLAGAPGDISQRVTYLHQIYLDSNGNHAFPLVASHGALWAKKYFDNIDLASFVMGLVLDGNALKRFSTALKSTNQTVFIDTYTNYYFSKLYGYHPAAAKLVDPVLLKKLNVLHEVNRAGGRLSPDFKRDLFHETLLKEQERAVTAAVSSAADAFPYSALAQFAFRPSIRFPYFPSNEALTFHHFESQAERVAAAMKAYDLAVAMGWRQVEQSVTDYGVLARGYAPPTLDDAAR